jgi:hypothetical protein
MAEDYGKVTWQAVAITWDNLDTFLLVLSRQFVNLGPGVTEAQ